MAVEEFKTSVADHPHRQADSGVAVKNLLHPGFQIELIDSGHDSPSHPAGGTARAASDSVRPYHHVGPDLAGKKEATGPGRPGRTPLPRARPGARRWRGTQG